MGAESRSPFRSALELRDECERLGCENEHIGRVRFEGDTTARQLCRPCTKEHLGVSS